MAYDSVASLAKTIDKILIHSSYIDLPGYQEIKSIHDHSTSLLPLLYDPPTETIGLVRQMRVLKYIPKSTRHESEEMDSIFEEIDSMIARSSDSRRKKLLRDFEEVMSLERRMTELANKAKDTIHIFVSEKIGSDCGSMKSSAGRWSTFKFKRRLRKVAEEMNSIVGEMKKVNRIMIEDPPLSCESAANSSSTFAPPIPLNDMVFGLDDDLMIITERLLNCTIDELETIPIVGSGGIGKTTLARYVYNDPLIVKHFPIRAWVTVSQDYNIKDILRSLIKDIRRSLLLYLGLQSKEDSPNEAEVTVEQWLYEKKYLIVIDDVWTERSWDRLRVLFEDCHKGSRIILTTRLKDIADYVGDSATHHQMNLMDDDQSWYLLWNKVFGDQGCPLEFELLGRKIARGCGGLPLCIVIMAELLSSIPMTLDSWEAISEDIISAISTKDGRLEKTIYSSFMELPHHLRQCLLYMGGFPKNFELGVSELTKLWVAEGFIKPYGSKTFEEVAEEYVEDLVKRNLVMVVSRTKYDSKIKSYSLQNFVRDFCMRKIQVRKFLLPLVDYLPDTTIRRHFLPKILQNQHRIILNSYDLHLKETIRYSPMRTKLCIQQGEYLPMGSVQKFPLLRVLHVVNKSDNLGWESDQVFELIHLRYLASNILSSCIPAGISNLQNLQTLIIYRHDVRLPEEIWRLVRLRHLIAFSFHPLPHPQLATSPLESLQTLSLVSNFECSEMILKITPNLKKLGICYCEDTSDQDYHLNNFLNLHQLEILKLVVHKEFSFGRALNPVFPVGLKKLTLSGCRLPWDDMTIIGNSLPNLEVLKLRDFAFQGDVWYISIEDRFISLKYLLIDGSDLKYWDSQPINFPKLVCLWIYRCPYLEYLSSDIGDFFSLELLEVDDQNEILVEVIREQQSRFWNKSLRVQVKHF